MFLFLDPLKVARQWWGTVSLDKMDLIRQLELMDFLTNTIRNDCEWDDELIRHPRLMIELPPLLSARPLFESSFKSFFKSGPKNGHRNRHFRGRRSGSHSSRSWAHRFQRSGFAHLRFLKGVGATVLQRMHAVSAIYRSTFPHWVRYQNGLTKRCLLSSTSSKPISTKQHRKVETVPITNNPVKMLQWIWSHCDGITRLV